MSYCSKEELRGLGLAGLGEDVLISKKTSLYNPGRISVGNHVRIDDFCVLSAGEGGIELGNYVHIAVFCSFIGGGKISFGDFTTTSARVSIYSSNDDYSGETLTNPTVPSRYKNVTIADVKIGKHVIIGSGTVVLPGVTIEEGAAIGALSLVNKNCPAFGMYGGVPVRRIGDRKRRLLELEKKFLEQNRSGFEGSDPEGTPRL